MSKRKEQPSHDRILSPDSKLVNTGMIAPTQPTTTPLLTPTKPWMIPPQVALKRPNISTEPKNSC